MNYCELKGQNESSFTAFDTLVAISDYEENFNVLDGEKLKKANENPDLYPDLVVRVTGFTAYFATLSPEFRQLVMDRFVEGI